MPGEEQQIWNMIDYVDRQVEHGMRIGANMQEVANILAGARMMLENDLTEEAANMTNQALELANSILHQYKLLVTEIRAVKKRISLIADDGGNVEEPTRLLMQASLALEKADYDAGMQYTAQCFECLEKSNQMPGILEAARPKKD